MGSLLSEEQRGALDQSIQLESQTADRPIDGGRRSDFPGRYVLPDPGIRVGPD